MIAILAESNNQTVDGSNNGVGWNTFNGRAEQQARTGLKVLMAVISSLFFLFIIAFLIRSQISDWEHLSAPWKPLANPWQLWVNTVLLIVASISLQWSCISLKKGNVRWGITALILAGVFTGAFIAGQLWVWKTLIALGYFVDTNPANSFFYLFTGLHALHVLGGLVAWLRVTVRAWRGDAIEKLEVSIKLCAMYWHYLLVLWLVLLALLTSSPETYEFLARLCGF